MVMDIKAQVHEALKLLAGQCDGASSRDNVGFNGYDANNGRWLASLPDLTPSQVLNAAKMLQKYHNQIEVPSLQAAKRYFAVNFNAVTVEADHSDYAGEQMEEETYTEDEQQDEKPEPQIEIETTEPEIILSDEQAALVKMMEESHDHLFITGRAGAGKSVLLRAFRKATKYNIVVTAPTGIAALNVQGQTIHSLFKLPTQLQKKGHLEPNEKANTLLKRVDKIIIDEISMVRADVLDALDERMRQACDNSLPFGGKQLIMIGDVFQLPPVVEKDLRDYFDRVYGGVYFFNATVWQKTEFRVYELTQIFRQKDSAFKDILNAVRDGSVVEEQIKSLNVRHGVALPKEGTVTLATTNALVTQINQERLDRLPGKAYQYNAVITGTMERNTFPTEERLYLKKDAQVVLLKNDQNGRWVNGSVGVIEKLSETSIEVRVNGIVHTLEKNTWEEIAYTYENNEIKEKVVSSFEQYPIRLAWALTVHKSQGQTYESVCLDLTRPTFAHGQLYVALSRATSLEGLYLKMPVKMRDVIVDPKVIEFMSRKETIDQYLAEEAVAIVEEAQELAEEVYEEGSDATLALVKEAVQIAEMVAPTEKSGLAGFFEQAIQDAAQRGFTVQAIVAPLAQPTHLEASETHQTAYPKVTDKPRGEKAVRAKKADELPTMVKVGYKFEESTVDFLKDLTEQVSGLNKSKWIEDMIRATPEYQEWLKKQGQ